MIIWYLSLKKNPGRNGAHPVLCLSVTEVKIVITKEPLVTDV